MLHAMIDLETLGRSHSAAIKQIGAVIWDDKFGPAALFDKFLVNVDLESSMEYGDVDASTLKWWLTQPQDTREDVWGDKAAETMPLPDALAMLAAFLSAIPNERKFFGAPAQKRAAPEAFWAHATFDFPILAHAYNQVGIKNPIDYRLCRDLRTIEMLFPVEWTKRHGTHHNALDDAEYQAINLQTMLQAWGDSFPSAAF